MPVPNIYSDPTWAYDVPGWTNQGNTGDIATTNSTTFEYLIEPAAASLYLARTIDPDVSASSAIVASRTLINCALVWVPAPILTTSVVFNVASVDVSPGSYKYWVLVNMVTRAVEAVTANSTPVYGATGMGTANWTAKTVISSGFHYIAQVNTAATAPGFTGVSPLQAEAQYNLSAGSTTAPLRFCTNSQTISTAPAVGATYLTNTFAAVSAAPFFGLI
jgi:hypothetical protein